jgi:hypothetical protein
MAEPVLISIAAALAGRAVVGLYQFVKDRFADNEEATAALEAAEQVTDATEESEEVQQLAEELERAEAADPEFGKRLRAEWATVRQHAETGGVTNQVTGTVHGKVLQARDIQGGVSF